MEKPWKKEKKSEKFIRQLFTLIPMLVFGGVIGFFSTKYSVDITDKIPTPLMIFLMILFLFITFILQVIIHETGHLVMGLLTGYEFLFYRIFRLLFIKENGKLKIRWHKNGSVAGQCCLYPPKMSTEKAEYPFFWYHAGGLLFNLIFSIISIVLLFRFHLENILFYPFFVPLAGWGILFFFQNAYPYSKTFTNDGSNIRRMKRSSASRLFFYNQIRSAASFSNGKHIKDMPVEEFLPKSKEHYGNDFLFMSWNIPYTETIYLHRGNIGKHWNSIRQQFPISTKCRNRRKTYCSFNIYFTDCKRCSSRNSE